ncbi:TAXI family TRAP transporter solute-binding subunit [Aquibacillus sediminis]|uniref:TAXI family TRAP transporter solute-binding subunit n=1 Tax=Aquibacillus sediminis TaxID=2574734 RepID=UPI0014865B96|nr:TAXI family TRAP transporter solute-binding subunit [Aquibacillus sediminis]
MGNVLVNKFHLFGVLLLSLLLTACGGAEATNSESSDTAKEEMETTIIGGRTGGAWSVFTEGIAESIRRENKDAFITVEPGGIVENPATVGTNTIPYGLSYAMTAYAAYKGEEPYDQAYEDVRAISVVIPANYYQFVVKADADYDSFEEIVEQEVPLRLAVDQKGSPGEMITRNILQEYGVTYDDIIAWGGSVDHLGGTKTFELMADNRIDGTGDALSVPSSDILEASTTMDFKMFSLDEAVIQAVSENLGMEAGVIEAGGYDFLKEDVATVNTPVILVVHKDVSEDEVYQVTKSIYENIDYLGTVHEEFTNLTDETIMDVGAVPLHPGAEKFFQDAGLVESDDVN